MPPPRPPLLSVSEAASHLANHMRRLHSGGSVWVEGLLSGLDRDPSRGGHKFFSLVERSTDGQQVVARLRAVMFKSDRDRINRKLSNARVGSFVRDDAVVRMLGTFTFHTPSGEVNFRVTDVDAASLRAEVLVGRDRVLQELKDAGIHKQNKALSLPPMPLRVGLVTSTGSAAHHDVERAFRQSGFNITLMVADTAVQGDAASELITAAIKALGVSRPEVLLLCRGGGSELDLRAFDDVKVARAVATCQMPVFTGVGHEIDEPVVDSVAHSSFATPTAAAEGVIRHLMACKDTMSAAASSLDAAVRAVISSALSRHASLSSNLDANTRLLVQTLRSRHAEAERSLGAAVSRSCAGLYEDHHSLSAALKAAILHALAERARDLDGTQQILEALDPQTRLNQGWSITTLADGRIVRTYSDVQEREALHTLLADGYIMSRVEHSAPTKGE